MCNADCRTRAHGNKRAERGSEGESDPIKLSQEVREKPIARMVLTDAATKSARGGFYLVSGSIIATVIMAIAAILIGRLLGPASYGEYTLAILVPQILLLFADLGINTGIIKFASSSLSSMDNEKTLRIMRHGMLFRVTAGLAIFLVGFMFADFFSSLFINRPQMGYYVQIASISILFNLVYDTAVSAFVGLGKAEYSALIYTAQAIGKTTISVALVLLGFGIAGAVTGYVGGFIVAGVLAALMFLRLVKTRKEDDPSGSLAQTFKTLTSYGLPIYISAIITGFLPLLQQVIIAFFASNTNIGNFRASSNFVVLIAVVPLSITTALLPGFSTLDSSTSEKIRTFFKRVNKYTGLLIVPATVLIVLFSRQIVQIIYGSAYQNAWFYLSLSCLVYFLVGMGHLGLVSLFNGLGETRTTLKIAMLNITVFLVLAPFLTSIYDVPGVIVSSLASSILATSYAAVIARKKFKIEFDIKRVARIYMVAGISGIIPLLLLLTHFMSSIVVLLVGGLFYLLTYATLVPLIGIIDHKELQTIMGIALQVKLLKMLVKPLVRYEEKILELRSPSVHMKPSEVVKEDPA